MATFTNQATLTYNGQTTTSNVTVGELVETLTAAKTAVVPTYDPDGRVTYVISLVNSGAAPLTGLTVTDDLGGYTFNGATVYPLSYTAGSVRYYQNGVLQTAPTVTAGPPLVFTGITVPAGGNAVIAYEAAPTAAAPRGAEGLVTNTATATGAGLVNPVTATETVSPTAAPRLSISKSLSPHHRDGERAADLHLRHAEHRQHGGGRRSRRCCHRHLRSPAQRSDRDPQRHGADHPGAVHL